MDAPTALQFIQSLSGMDQGELALKLHVSLVTMNRWINGKAQPKPDAVRRIGRLLQDYSGVPEVPSDMAEAKKGILHHKASISRNVLSTILDNPDIHNEFVLSLTYNSNQIEGSTLTMEETAIVLFQDGTVPRKTLAEQIEAKNHQAALHYLFRLVAAAQPLDEACLLKLHGMMMNGLRDDAGLYRRHAVRIVGADVATANPLKVPRLMEDLIRSIGRPARDIVAQTAAIHSRFEQIHPFSDGNGRVGRMLIHAMLFRKNYPPAVIRRETKRAYYAALNKSQRYGDSTPLEEFLCDAVFAGWRILERQKPV